jgi:hypothetical protein
VRLSGYYRRCGHALPAWRLPQAGAIYYESLLPDYAQCLVVFEGVIGDASHPARSSI